MGVLKLGSDLALVSTRPEMNAVSEKQLQDGFRVKTSLLVTMVDGGMKYNRDTLGDVGSVRRRRIWSDPC